MIIDIIYGIKIPQNLINELKNNDVKENIIAKFKKYIGVPLDDQNEFFPSSEIYFDQDNIFSFDPDILKVKLKAKKNTILRYEEMKSRYLYDLCEELPEKVKNIIAYIHDTKPRIMFVAEDLNENI